MLRTVDSRGNWFTRAADGARSFLLAQGNWDWDGSPATAWSRFWVIIYSVGGVPWSEIDWGDVGLTWGQADLTWGSTATAAEVAAVRGIVRYWKPAHARCEKIIVVLDDAAAFDPTDPPGPPLPDGTWGDNWTYSAGAAVFPRYRNAAYWPGS
jgi:hypothetical protein